MQLNMSICSTRQTNASKKRDAIDDSRGTQSMIVVGLRDF